LPLPARDQGYAVAILMALVHMMVVGDRFLLSILIEPIKVELALRDGTIGLLQGPAFAVVNGLAVIPMVLLARRWSLAWLLAAALAGSSIATIACGLAGSGALLAAARMMLGLAQAAIGPAALGLIVATMTPAHAGRGISMFTGGAALGRGVAMIGGGALLAIFAGLSGGIAPWRMVFVTGGLIGLPLALVLLGLGRSVGAGRRAGVRIGAALRHMLAERAVLLPHMLAALSAVLMAQALTNWAASLLIRLHGLTPPRAGLYVGLAMMLAGAFGHGLGGLLADRWGRGAPKLLLLGLAMGTLALWPLTRTADLPLALAALVVAAIGLSITLANGMIGLQSLVPPALRVEATAIFLTLVTLLGTALGPWAVGAASQALAHPTGLGKGLADAMGGVLGLTGLVGCGAALVAARQRRARG
jgi:MFS family permease